MEKNQKGIVFIQSFLEWSGSNEIKIHGNQRFVSQQMKEKIATDLVELFW